jgi:hypothetical protein
VFPASPQLAPPEEQQFSPEGTAERQYSTAVLSELVDLNGSAAAFEVAVVNKASRNRIDRMIFAFEASLISPFIRSRCATPVIIISRPSSVRK